jgi:uncharacterized protein
MRRADIIEMLNRRKDAIRALGVDALYLYGSHVRDEAGPESDVDLFFDRIPDRKLSLFDLMDLKLLAEEVLGTAVDIGTRTGLHPVLKAEIERSALRVF